MATDIYYTSLSQRTLCLFCHSIFIFTSLSLTNFYVNSYPTVLVQYKLVEKLRTSHHRWLTKNNLKRGFSRGT